MVRHKVDPGRAAHRILYEGPKTSGTDLTFQNKAEEGVGFRRKKEKEEVRSWITTQKGIGQEAKRGKKKVQVEQKKEWK